jgi:aquaporin Z
MNSLHLLSEFLGTFLLVMAVLATSNPLVVGGTLALIVLLLGDVSGGHVNPAVSLAMMLKGALGTVEFVGYSVAQLVGGAAAWYAYKVLA